MAILIKQELFKMYKKKSSIIFPIIIFLLMVLFAFLSKEYPDIFEKELQFKSGFSGFSWVAFLMIVQASTIITMEFAYGTIKNLLYRKYSRMQILFSKYIALFLYSLCLFVGIVLISFVIKLIFFNDMDITHSSNNNMNLIQELALNAIGNYIGLWLILSITLLLSCIMKSPGLSITLGIVLYFALSIISGIMFMLIDKWEWLKWNPLNMMNISAQLLDNKEFSKLTHLNLTEMFIGNFVYIAILLTMVVFIFNKKNV